MTQLLLEKHKSSSKLVSYNRRNLNLQVNVTADHRVIYGADLASFLQTLSLIIEDPKDLTFQSHFPNKVKEHSNSGCDSSHQVCEVINC